MCSSDLPGNDDAIRSCGLVVKAIADGIEAGKQRVSQAELRAPRNGGEEKVEAPAEAETPAEHEVLSQGEATVEGTVEGTVEPTPEPPPAAEAAPEEAPAE